MSTLRLAKHHELPLRNTLEMMELVDGKWQASANTRLQTLQQQWLAASCA